MHFLYSQEEPLFDTSTEPVKIVEALLSFEQLRRVQDGSIGSWHMGMDINAVSNSLFENLVATFALQSWAITVFRINYMDQDAFTATIAYLNRPSWQNFLDLGMATLDQTPDVVYGLTLEQIGFQRTIVEDFDIVLAKVVQGIPVSREAKVKISNPVNPEENLGNNVYYTQTIPIHDEQGRVVYAFTTSRNITHISDRDTLLDETSQEALRVISEFVDMQDRAAEQKTIVHDGNNFLTLILGNAEMLGDDIEDLKRKYSNIAIADIEGLLKSLVPIIESARNMQALFRQMRELTQNRKNDFRIIDLPKKIKGILLLECNNQYQQYISDNFGGKIRINIAEGFILKAMPFMVRIIISNLIRNSMDAIIEKTLSDQSFQGHGEVRISCSMDEELMSVIEISDNGTGIDPKILDKIFNVGFTTKRGKVLLAGGLGVGLSNIRDYVHIHSGIINVESQFGAGTKFTIKLPYSMAPADYEDYSVAA